MDWYLPITILPGIGMLILSTTNQMMALSNEIGSLLSVKCSPFNHSIADKKIKQLTRLTRAGTLQYISAGCFVLSGITNVLITNPEYTFVANLVLYIGVLLFFISLALLIIYGYRTIIIRKAQHKQNRKMVNHTTN